MKTTKMKKFVQMNEDYKNEEIGLNEDNKKEEVSLNECLPLFEPNFSSLLSSFIRTNFQRLGNLSK